MVAVARHLLRRMQRSSPLGPRSRAARTWALDAAREGSKARPCFPCRGARWPRQLPPAKAFNCTTSNNRESPLRRTGVSCGRLRRSRQRPRRRRLDHRPLLGPLRGGSPYSSTSTSTSRRHPFRLCFQPRILLLLLLRRRRRRRHRRRRRRFRRRRRRRRRRLRRHRSP
jgi:hypothetical protein